MVRNDMSYFKNSFPMQLQLFAESGEGGDQSGSDAGASGQQDNKPTYEELQKLLEQSESRASKLKDSVDKLTREKGELTKEKRAGMTETELAKQALQDEIDELRRQNEEIMESNRLMAEESRIAKNTKSFMATGMDETTAEALSKAVGELADSDKFFSGLTKFVTDLKKSTSENAVQDFLKDRPDIQANNGASDKNTVANERATLAAKRNGKANEDILKHYMH